MKTITGMRLTGKAMALLAALLAFGIVSFAGSVSGQATPAATGPVLQFDVAEDMSRFTFDDAFVHEDGMPAHGSSFITQGYIYPKGTLTGSNGVLPDGSPEFPELVIGEWTCRGWFVGEGAHAATGPMVVSTQIYNFGETLGADMLITDGYELVDVGVAIQRAITGGTGAYQGIDGVLNQTFLGFNASEGVNLSLDVVLSE